MAYRPVVELVDGWPVPDVGRFVHPITIWKLSQSSSPEYDAAGPVMSWQQFSTAMAAIETLRGTDMVRGGQDVSRLFVEVTFWYQPGIDASMKVTDARGMTYMIQSVDNVQRRDVVIRLNCLELGVNA